MKNLLRLVLSLLFVTLLSTASFPCFAESFHTPAFEMESQITPRADIIEWHYKTLNGRLYRRLFNVTQDKWVGDWEPVG